MKYLLILAIAVLVVWLWRNNRRDAGVASQQASPQRPDVEQRSVTEMVACEICHVHLPRSEALPGRNGSGFYCCEAHRNKAAN